MEVGVDDRNPAWQKRMRIRFDFHNMMPEAVGREGISLEEIHAIEGRLEKAVEALQAGRGKGDLGWMELPYQRVEEILTFAASARERFDDVVVLGIGGSALGNIALQTALTPPFYNLLPREARGGPRLFVLDTVDPVLVEGIFQILDPQKTVVHVISKSGTTAETMAQFLIFRRVLREAVGAKYPEHVVATTDARQGELRRLAAEEGYRTFTIPEGVGGRFSVLSPVGLLTAAICGIDIQGLLAGAAYGDRLCREKDVWKNPAAMSAALQYLAYQKGKRLSVLMPYAQALEDVADWYRQLWAESLGKRLSRGGEEVFVGPTPIKALGPTDQHSQLQLYLEGPFDKVVHFLFVERFPVAGEIPPDFHDREGVGYLGGHTLAELMRAEGEATALALTEAGRLNCAYILPEVNPFTVGQLFFLLEIQTALAAELYDIHAFSQPGVEAVKVATYALLGRRGFEGHRLRIEERKRRTNLRYVI
jgi:glucose-6-phosphate isomerase